MKNVIESLTRHPLYLLAFCLVFTLGSCEDDDDGLVQEEPTGFVEVPDEEILVGDTLTVQSVTVGQDSWLVAVNTGDENTTNFISDPVMVENGTTEDVQVVLEDNAIDQDGQEISLILFADNPTEGNLGEWDETDEPITDENDILIAETVFVYPEDSTTAVFRGFDENNDGSLDETEVPAIYADNFGELDTDGDGNLDENEFFTGTFMNTDEDEDTFIDQEEWNLGFDSTFNRFVEAGDFSAFDTDGDGVLSADEWNAGFGGTAWWDDFDANDDAFVSEAEWDSGLFAEWDTDDDAMISEDEFSVFDDYVFTW